MSLTLDCTPALSPYVPLFQLTSSPTEDTPITPGDQPISPLQSLPPTASHTTSLLPLIKALEPIARPFALSPYTETHDIPDILNLNLPSPCRNATRHRPRAFLQAKLMNRSTPQRRTYHNSAQRGKNFFLFRALMQFDEGQFKSYDGNSSAEDDVVMDFFTEFKNERAANVAKFYQRRPHIGTRKVPIYNPYCFPRRGKLVDLRHHSLTIPQTNIHHDNIGALDLRPLHTVGHQLRLRGVKMMQDFETNTRLNVNRGETWIDEKLLPNGPSDPGELMGLGYRCRTEMADRLERLRPPRKTFVTVPAPKVNVDGRAAKRFRGRRSADKGSLFWQTELAIAEVLRAADWASPTPFSGPACHTIYDRVGQANFEYLATVAAHRHADHGASSWFTKDADARQLQHEITPKIVLPRHGEFVRQSLVPDLVDAGAPVWELNDKQVPRDQLLHLASQQVGPARLRDVFEAFDEERRRAREAERATSGLGSLKSGEVDSELEVENQIRVVEDDELLGTPWRRSREMEELRHAWAPESSADMDADDEDEEADSASVCTTRDCEYEYDEDPFSESSGGSWLSHDGFWTQVSDFLSETGYLANSDTSSAGSGRPHSPTLPHSVTDYVSPRKQDLLRPVFFPLQNVKRVPALRRPSRLRRVCFPLPTAPLRRSRRRAPPSPSLSPPPFLRSQAPSPPSPTMDVNMEAALDAAMLTLIDSLPA